MLAMMLKSKSTWQGAVQQDLSMTIHPDDTGHLHICILGYDSTNNGQLQIDMDPLSIEESQELMDYLQTRINQARQIKREVAMQAKPQQVYRSGDAFPPSAIPSAPVPYAQPPAPQIPVPSLSNHDEPVKRPTGIIKP